MLYPSKIYSFQNIFARKLRESEKANTFCCFLFSLEAISLFTRLMEVGGIAADNGPCGCGRWLLHGYSECRSAINLYTYT